MLDDILHNWSSVVVPFLTLEDVTALQYAKTDFNSERSSIQSSQSSFIRTQQYKPRALVKLFLKLMEGDVTRFGSNNINNRDLWNIRASWEFGDWENIGGAQRFDIGLPNATRDLELAQRFVKTFGCSPARCFGLYQSMLRSNIDRTLPQPEHILWTCLYIKQYHWVASSIGRSAAFVGADSPTEFMTEVSKLISFVSELFDEASEAREAIKASETNKNTSPSPPTRYSWYSAGFSPYPVNKSALYMSVCLLDSSEGNYEYEIVADLPPLTNLGGELMLSGIPGYISHVAVRYCPNQTVKPFLERALEFYQKSLKTRLREGEMVVMADRPITVPSERILSKQYVRNHGQYVPNHGHGHAGVLTAIESESTRIKNIKRFFHRYSLLYCGAVTEGEAEQLGNAIFVAHLINIGMANLN